MQPSGSNTTGLQTMSFAAPYPAALSIPNGGWRSHLARDSKIPLAKPVIQIGRMEGNDVVLTDPLVSRHHALVRWTSGGYELEDLGAPNGTFIEGQRVSGRVALAPGNLLRLGNTEMVFQVLSSDASTNDANAVANADPKTQSGFVVRPALPGAGALGPGGRAPSPPPPVSPPALSPFQAPAYSTRAAPPVMAPQPTAAAVVGPAHPYYAMLAKPDQGRLGQLFRSQARKQYWRIFLLGLLGYFVVAQVLASTSNPHLVPLEMLLASALVPVVFVVFCWEQNAFADMPASVVGITFASGGVLGLCLAAVLESVLLPKSLAVTGITLPIAITVGVVEETVKVVSVVWFLRNNRLRSELDGLILGAAAGKGFAAFETAGYGFSSFVQGFVTSANTGSVTLIEAVRAGAGSMNHVLLLRMAVAVFGHGVWTAIICAAIWRERGQSTFRLTGGVVTAFAIAVGLHALWDWSPLVHALGPQPSGSSVVLVTTFWCLLVGFAGLLVLRFFLRESLQRAKLGPYAPAPPPLLSALLRDFASLFGGGRPPAVQSWAQPMAPPGQPYPVAPAPPQPQRPAPPPPVARPTYCPRCSIGYPPQTQRCANCGGPVFPVPL